MKRTRQCESNLVRFFCIHRISLAAKSSPDLRTHAVVPSNPRPLFPRIAFSPFCPAATVAFLYFAFYQSLVILASGLPPQPPPASLSINVAASIAMMQVTCDV
jgi:hypothetical protein